ncbi:MAG: rhomboid family intramembrane serine protease [Pirellulales bacterium]|nr:rhomboid family intramembrane serine protease [Pirellulales bacterium]
MLPALKIDFRSTPVTLLVTAVALALEVVSTFDPSPDMDRRFALQVDWRLVISWPIWEGEWWRPLTTTLLHGNLLHAGFNIYWMLVLGPIVEGRIGALRYAGLLLVLCYVPVLLDYLVVMHPAVGLSGAVYGLFGMMWVGRRREPYWGVVVNDETVRVMMVWFFFCIAATYLGWMPVANVAHGWGLALGVLAGMVLIDTRRRPAWIGAFTLATVVPLIGLFWAPWHPGYRLVRYNRAAAKYRHQMQPLSVELEPGETAGEEPGAGLEDAEISVEK